MSWERKVSVEEFPGVDLSSEVSDLFCTKVRDLLLTGGVGREGGSVGGRSWDGSVGPLAVATLLVLDVDEFAGDEVILDLNQYTSREGSKGESALGIRERRREGEGKRRPNSLPLLSFSKHLDHRHELSCLL